MIAIFCDVTAENYPFCAFLFCCFVDELVTTTTTTEFDSIKAAVESLARNCIHQSSCKGFLFQVGPPTTLMFCFEFYRFGSDRSLFHFKVSKRLQS